MARTTDLVFDTGDTFPKLEMDTVHHGRVRLPSHFGGDWGVLLIYRAHW